MRSHLVLGAVAFVLASATTLRAADVFVDTLDLTKIHQEAGAKPAGTVGGKKPDHVVSIGPAGSLVIDLKGTNGSFSTSVALDDASGPDSLARFYIIGDGKVLAESGIMKKGDPAKPLKAELDGVKQLVLRTDAAGTNHAVADFIDPKCTPAGGASVRPVALAAEQATPELVVNIDELDITKATTGWNEPQINKSAEHNPITLRGKTFTHALGTHALSTFVINLKGAGKTFTATVGVDDDAEDEGSVGFTIIGDGKVLAKSGTVTRTEPAKTLTADLTGVQQLVLLVDGGDDDNINNDHADWADAKITLDPAKAKDRPEARPATEAKLPH